MLRSNYDPCTDGAVEAIQIYMADDGFTVLADLAFAFGGIVTINWTDTKQRGMYAAGISGYTYMYDRRTKGAFATWVKPALR